MIAAAKSMQNNVPILLLDDAAELCEKMKFNYCAFRELILFL